MFIDGDGSTLVKPSLRLPCGVIVRQGLIGRPFVVRGVLHDGLSSDVGAVSKLLKVFLQFILLSRKLVDLQRKGVHFSSYLVHFGMDLRVLLPQIVRAIDLEVVCLPQHM